VRLGSGNISWPGRAHLKALTPHDRNTMSCRYQCKQAARTYVTCTSFLHRVTQATESWVCAGSLSGQQLSSDQRAMSVNTVDETNVADLYLDFARPHKCLSRNEDRDAERMCEAATSFLLDKAKALVRKLADSPILISYGSDATPMKCKAYFNVGLATQTNFRRVGSRLTEFLVQNCFIKGITPTGQEVAYLVKDPLPLRAGKGALPLFSAMCRFFPLARTLGHTSVVVTHYVFDRALQAPLLKLAEKRHGLYYQRQGGPAPRTGAIALLELQYWVVSTGCAAHDCHNAAMWGAMGHLEGQG
jgi:hypothetical protein